MTSFDPAMLSRIHLPIKYGTLSKSQRRAIWRARFGKQLPLDDVELDKLVEAGQQFSGRDIRNVVQMAMHLGSTGGAKNGEKWENIPTYDEETKRARFQSVLDLVTIRQENLSAFTTDDADDMESS
jgi:SpoVK/Ycf46/Vps4 family AAA+-type ATPase